MDYARGLLEKYGWTEGKGLGKNETGISEALKPSLKFDTSGIGHDHSDQFTFKWWEIAFNDAANRIEVQKSDSGGALIRTDESKNLHFSTKKPWTAKLKSDNNLEYGSFVKTETLTSEGELISLNNNVDPVLFVDPTTSLSDEELFRICGGRTAHKAARHGHKLVGKLARVIEQEKKLLIKREEDLTVLENVDEDRVPKKKKKKRKYEHTSEDSVQNASVDARSMDIENAGEIRGNSKKKKIRVKEEKSEKSSVKETEQEVDSFIVKSSVIEMKKKKKKRKYAPNSEKSVEDVIIDNNIVQVESPDDLKENTKKEERRQKKSKREKSCEIESGQQRDDSVDSVTAECSETVKKRKKKSRNSTVSCTEHVKTSDSIEYPSISDSNENIHESKKKKKRN